jgi:hypothetical protein
MPRSARGALVAALLTTNPLTALAQGTPAPAEPAPPTEAPKPPAEAPKAEAKPETKPPPLFTVLPYGIVHAAYYRALDAFAARDYPGQATITADGGGDLASARASRFGLRVVMGEPVWGAKLSGVIEGDFKGSFIPTTFTTTTTTNSKCTSATPPVCTSTSTSSTSATAPSTSWSNPLFRIRHANVKAAWATSVGEVSVVAGQDWTLLAPLAPATVVFLADQLFTNAGNLNRRAPQLKVAYDGAGDVGLNAAAAVLSPSDAGTPVDFGQGNRSRRPDVEGRIGLFARSGGAKVFEVGVSGHRNVRRYLISTAGATQDVPEWAGAFDAVLNIPLLTIQGEGFTGRAIDDTYAGIAPAVNSVLGNNSVRTKGLWGQAIVKPIALIDLMAAWGTEQVMLEDVVKIAARTKNTMYGGGVFVNAHRAWKIGLEAYKTISYTQDAKNASTRAEGTMLAVATRLDFT